MPPVEPQNLVAPPSPKPTASQKALAAAFLAHQVEELQNRVDGMNMRGRGRGGGPRGGGRGGRGAGARGGAMLDAGFGNGLPSAGSRPLFDPDHPHPPPPSSSHHHNGSSLSQDRGSDLHHHHAHPDSHHHSHTDRPPPRQQISPPNGSPLIIDASALIHAFPVVRSWINSREHEIIVPSEVLHTLDLLKKGESPLSSSVRSLTRYLETHLSSPPRPSNSSSASTTPKWTGLRVSLPSESSPPVLLPDETPPPPPPAPPSTEDAPATSPSLPSSTPRPPPPLELWTSNILSVPTHFLSTPSSSSQKPILVLSSPFPIDDPSLNDLLEQEDPYHNHLRAEGTVLASVAEKYGVQTFWIEPVPLRSENFGGGGRGRGRGGSDRGRGEGERGGRGGGRGGRNEEAAAAPPPAVKKMVLMKRGDPVGGNGGGGAAPPPVMRLMKRGEE
ncbi:hypothetical protein BDY24DRAFT_402954 [Mrakia frigida]|uniref:uncharacterized protein n=1 Tax=Mrakia frigida TaxID=29902 RepID=UPI003FCC011D